MKKISLPVLGLFFLSIAITSLFSQQKPTVGIDEQLGSTIPMNLKFFNSKGDTLLLSQLIDRPVVLSFAYYHCQALCNTLLSGLRDAVDKVKLKPGTDFRVLTISFDQKETSQIASKWKHTYMSLEGTSRVLPDDSWYFMTGDSQNIRTLTNAVGYYFVADGHSDFNHPAAIMVLSPRGKITRYLFGTEFSPFDLKMALIEALEGKPMPTISKLLEYCYSYDPESKHYVINFMRIIGAFMLVAVGSFLAVLLIKGRKNKISNISRA